jgi:hypothetical protein
MVYYTQNYWVFGLGPTSGSEVIPTYSSKCPIIINNDTAKALILVMGTTLMTLNSEF